MPVANSDIAVAQEVALTRGPGRGSSAPDGVSNLRILSDVASVPVGTFATTEYARFGRIPKGARIYRSLGSYISTDHSAAISGTLQLVPINGGAPVTLISGVVANVEATETTSIPDCADDVKVDFDGFVQFVPSSNTTIASTPKKIWLRLVYGQSY
jgi:hypothetical protein